MNAKLLQPTAALELDAGGGVLAALSAAEELAQCQTLDVLLQRAVELCVTRLGLERVSLFLDDEHACGLRGTWSSSVGERLVDERQLTRPFGELEREAHRRVEAGVGRWMQLREGAATSDARAARLLAVTGPSWQILTPVRSLNGPIGIFYNDAPASQAPPELDKQVRMAVFASAIGNLLQARREPPLPASVPRGGVKFGALVRKAIVVLNEDPGIATNLLAARLQVGIARLRRAFQVELSVSLVQYRNRLRLERFFGLVERQGDNFLHAARTAGFGSYAQFHRTFRQHVGVAPREYLTTRQG